MESQTGVNIVSVALRETNRGAEAVLLFDHFRDLLSAQLRH
jgi:hypothetical protein